MSGIDPDDQSKTIAPSLKPSTGFSRPRLSSVRHLVPYSTPRYSIDMRGPMYLYFAFYVQIASKQGYGG